MLRLKSLTYIMTILIVIILFLSYATSLLAQEPLKFDIKTPVEEKNVLIPAVEGAKVFLDNSNWSKIVEWSEDYSISLRNYKREPFSITLDLELRTPATLSYNEGKVLRSQSLRVPFNYVIVQSIRENGLNDQALQMISKKLETIKSLPQYVRLIKKGVKLGAKSNKALKIAHVGLAVTGGALDFLTIGMPQNTTETQVEALLIGANIADAIYNMFEHPAPSFSGNISEAWLEHSIFQSNIEGMFIHANFFVNNVMNKECRIVAYFFDPYGNPMQDRNSDYTSYDGQVSSGEDLVPMYQSTEYSDFKIFIPYDELHLGYGNHEVCFLLAIYEKSTELIFVETEYYCFELGVN